MNKRYPSPEQIKTLRKKASLTQEEAAHLVHLNVRCWARYEAGGAKMLPAIWELFTIKTRKERGKEMEDILKKYNFEPVSDEDMEDNLNYIDFLD